MPVTLRPYQADDAPAVIDLWLQCHLTRSWNNPTRDLERKGLVQPELFLVALQGVQLVGSVMAGFDGHRGWLNYLAVHPDVQRQGVGRLLVEEAERQLLALGCPKVNLQIRCSNQVAQAFYRKLGYAEDAALSFGKRLEFDSEASAVQGGTGTGGCTVRTAWEPGDLGALIRLQVLLRLEAGGPAETEGLLALELAQFQLRTLPQERIWLAEKEGQLRGSLGLVQVSATQGELKWWGLHVDERRKGLGTQLLKEALAFAQQGGLESVQIDVPHPGGAAQRTLQQHGFELMEEPKKTAPEATWWRRTA